MGKYSAMYKKWARPYYKYSLSHSATAERGKQSVVYRDNTDIWMEEVKMY